MTRAFRADSLPWRAGDAWEVCTSPPSLRDGEVHVWKVALECAAEHANTLGARFTAEERARAARFRFAKDRERFVAGRGVVRLLAAAYLSRDASAIEMETEEGGKPRLIWREGEPPLQFNVSHSGEVVAIAFAMERRVGIDVEKIRDDVDWHEIAKRFFCAEEFEKLQRLPEQERRHGFFRCWTRKEALAKAIGPGLGLGLSDFYAGLGLSYAETPGLSDTEKLGLRDGAAAGLSVASLRDAQGREYSVTQFEPEAGYAGAVAAESTTSGCRLLEWNPAALGL